MNQIQKCIYPFARSYLLQILTNHLGTVIEQEDKIICYVKSSIFKNQKNYLAIQCPGIGEKEEKIAHFFHLNKPIYYVFQNMKFLSNSSILGYQNGNTHIFIKNCEFPLGIDIVGFDQCVIKDTSIDLTSSYCSISTECLKMKNVTINDPFESSASLDSFVKIEANKIYLKSSTIGKENEEKLKVNIEANERCVLSDSQIYGKNIKLMSPLLDMQNSILQEKENIQIHSSHLTYTKKNKLSMVGR